MEWKSFTVWAFLLILKCSLESDQQKPDKQSPTSNQTPKTLNYDQVDSKYSTARQMTRNTREMENYIELGDKGLGFSLLEGSNQQKPIPKHQITTPKTLN